MTPLGLSRLALHLPAEAQNATPQRGQRPELTFLDLPEVFLRKNEKNV